MPAFVRSEKAPKKEMERLLAQVNQLKAQLSNPYEVTKALGETLVTQTERRFEAKKGPDQEVWAPWSKSYARTRKAGDSLLVDNSSHKGTGPHLKDSFKPQIDAGAITVSTDVPYAMFLHRGTRKMRARPFIGMSRDDLAELQRVTEDVLAAQTVAVFTGVKKGAASKRKKRK